MPRKKWISCPCWITPILWRTLIITLMVHLYWSKWNIAMVCLLQSCIKYLQYIFRMRLSWIWRIQQIKEGVIRRGPRPRWITPCHVSLFLKGFHHFALCFSAHQKNTSYCPQVFSVNSAIICSRLHFWLHWFNIWSTAAGCGCCVLGQDTLLSQCLSPPRYINGYQRT